MDRQKCVQLSWTLSAGALRLLIMRRHCVLCRIGPSDKWLSHKDKLNLAGLLEVLDGVVDCPNRLIVMTSNHPEVSHSPLQLDTCSVKPVADMGQRQHQSSYGPKKGRRRP